MLLILYVVSIFTSAALLFLVQPMAARMALPIFGGSPSVWNTSMVFFQAALLLGYLYAHLVSSRLRAGAQVVVHAVFIAVALAMLPVALPSGDLSAWAQSPIGSLLRFLAVSVGVPFLFTSTAGPLLQRWFSRTGHRTAGDPYFLYAASNAGSLLGLLAYPFVIEPNLSLHEQARAWSVGFAVFCVLALACGVVSWRAARGTAPSAASSPAAGTDATPPIPRRTLWRWALLAFVPSSLMLGVTQYISTDIAAVPLLWVVPLTLYLLTFIVAFSTAVRVRARIYGKIVPFLVLAVALTYLMKAREPVWLVVSLHLASFFVSALMCHRLLAEERPPPARLTTFFLMISVGGVLGGVFNSLIAPVVFERVFEYPIAAALACLLLPGAGLMAGKTPVGVVWRWGAGPIAALVAMVAMKLITDHSATIRGNQNLGLLLHAGVPALVCFLFKGWPVSYALGLLVAMAVSLSSMLHTSLLLHVERTFFGVYEVSTNRARSAHFLNHGTTRHGAQWTQPPQSFKPLTYYYPSGPVGDVMDLVAGEPGMNRFALIGLGVGTMAAYGQPGETFNFYEIDPAVVRIARDPAMFTYLRDATAEVNIVLGDGRLKINEAPAGGYGLVVVDAFSSDAIPVHLLTVEAIEAYLRTLTPDGLVVLHISNRFFDLEPVLAAAAERLDLRAAKRDDLNSSDAEVGDGKSTSNWVVLARTDRYVRPLIEKASWQTLDRAKGRVLWTDDFSSILRVMR